jgi:hypothetical protein
VPLGAPKPHLTPSVGSDTGGRTQLEATPQPPPSSGLQSAAKDQQPAGRGTFTHLPCTHDPWQQSRLSAHASASGTQQIPPWQRPLQQVSAAHRCRVGAHMLGLPSLPLPLSGVPPSEARPPSLAWLAEEGQAAAPHRSRWRPSRRPEACRWTIMRSLTMHAACHRARRGMVVVRPTLSAGETRSAWSAPGGTSPLIWDVRVTPARY